MTVTPGEILAGKYRVDRVLGAGGMGVVVAAHHIQLDERVAIKFLLPEMLASPEAVTRFAREARAAVKIKNEHVARVFDVGTLETGAPYMVMEYLEGGDLAAWLQQRGALAVEQTVELVLQACEALAEAHGLGIIHRDLKPSNLFCIRRADGGLSIKVLDFGISKMTGIPGSGSGADLGFTRTAAVMGSPYYMSPEQMQSARAVDARTDIWAIGVILFELLARTVPFRGETLPEVCVKIATEPPPPLRNFRPDAPAGIEAVILRCLEKDRERRYRNVAELAVALVEFGPKRARASVERITGTIQAAGLSASALALPPSSDSDGASPGAVGGTMASWGRTGAPRASASRTIALGAVGAIGVFGVVAAVMVSRAASTGPTPATTPAVDHSAAPLAALSHPSALPTESAVHDGLPITPAMVASAAPALSAASGVESVDAMVAPAAAQATAASAGGDAGAAPRRSPPRPPAKSNCNPNYVLDSQGRKRFKPECF